MRDGVSTLNTARTAPRYHAETPLRQPAAYTLVSGSVCAATGEIAPNAIGAFMKRRTLSIASTLTVTFTLAAALFATNVRAQSADQDKADFARAVY